MHILLILISSFLSLKVFSFDPNSAHRTPGTSFEAYENRAIRDTIGVQSSEPTVLDRATYFSQSGLRDATHWPSYSKVLTRFRHVRDVRFLNWLRNPDFTRRSSWLYPDDGCYIRAALAVINARKLGAGTPNKVFAFGNLKATTANSPKGYVTWWYHVAPIVQVGSTKYVLDPAIEPSKPLTLTAWLSRMGDPATMKVAICGSGAYVPSSTCKKISDGTEGTATKNQNKFLDYEWDRLVKLGRNPELELGGSPPWSN
ncbi:MAG TPA: protein-glutamine glutaminase family protein [Bacteriovoracaceae bacterium]|nr:protein-glutamine glutaminase family protein [Bacteriovoracaceae bacterium]